ncbi:cation:proton antiporter [Lactococcus termiticola]|uniref:Na+/H+ antiporter n=1 Tax=Lactococcus termiticola TaxID=2169526 RepID=A0A2R5HD94_9LACT|nr:sodium:proton antiporter [Lactococcus termiticola]GBG96047.1 Na+/H+ antiporter [Lactococcus termiticola]
MLHTIFYVIVFLIALVVSNVLNKIFPKLALPLIQVVIGLGLGFMGASNVLHIEPEVFLGFIIAPLLFRESEEADVQHIFKHTRLVLLLILPLVFITALGLGYLMQLLYVGLPLAAAVALGAALAPTDAVAVKALTERFSFPKRVLSSLQGEGLLNDASGIITFQIAVLAMTTGKFSIPHASWELLISAVGGAAIGFIVVSAKNMILRVLENVDARDVTGYLIMEFLLPLAAFLIANIFDVSGILAVVVAGILQANGIKRTTLFDATVTRVKNNLWDMVSFILNSTVFLFLGIELHQLVLPLIQHPHFSNVLLLVWVLVLTVALFLLRFLVLCFYHIFAARRHGVQFSSFWTDIQLLTFSGSKGTVSIATILLLPAGNSLQNSLLIFLVASVTALSFLTGLLVLPRIAAKKAIQVDNMAKIAILTEVVESLQEQRQKAEKVFGFDLAIDAYQDRIQRLIIEQESANTSADFNELQLLIIQVETESLETALKEDEISLYTYRTYQRYIHSLEQAISHNFVSSVQYASALTMRGLHYLTSNLFHSNGRRKQAHQSEHDETQQQITELYLRNTELILQVLENLEAVYEPQLINYLQSERLRSTEFVASGTYISRMVNRAQSSHLEEMMMGYYFERKTIFEYESSGQISSEVARQLRQNVNTLEDYSLVSDDHSLWMDLFNRRQRKVEEHR